MEPGFEEEWKKSLADNDFNYTLFVSYGMRATQRLTRGSPSA